MPHRYNPNTLLRPSLVSPILQQLTTGFRVFITQALKTSIDAFSPSPPTSDSSRETFLYHGSSGLALTLLRLRRQLPDLLETVNVEPADYLPRHFHRHEASTLKVSALDTKVGPAVVEILRQLVEETRSLSQDDSERLSICLETVRSAAQVAANETQAVGGDEVLYGRAGLLWALENIRVALLAIDGDDERKRLVESLLLDDVQGRIVKRIVEAGHRGRALFEHKHHDAAIDGGVKDLVLMWPWHDSFYLGAIHGIAGILTVLMQLPRSQTEPYRVDIVKSALALCRIAAACEYRLPSSLPSLPFAGGHHQKTELCQICHGTPGLVLLLAVIPSYLGRESPELQDFVLHVTRACERVWEEGLVKKGLSLCHGIAGNAWVLLLAARAWRGVLEDAATEVVVKNALAMLVEAGVCEPLKMQWEVVDGWAEARRGNLYLEGEHPYGLFTGALGAACAWADAVVFLEEWKSGDIGTSKVLGMPGLGGAGSATGFL